MGEIFPNDKMLAEILHCSLCKENVNSCKCNWYNENDWNEEEHQIYLNKARKALGIADFNTVVKLTNILS